MVFERQHHYVNRAIGPVGDVNGHIMGNCYNNTNVSGYINRKRIAQRQWELKLERLSDSSGEGYYYDPPPPDYFD